MGRVLVYIPREPRPEDVDIEFRTLGGVPVAHGYIRMVIGGRGAYLEFSTCQMVRENISIPADQRWRQCTRYSYVFYDEYRSKDGVKIYLQRRRVRYADYKVGMWYISPANLVTDKYPKLIDLG